MAKKTSAKSRPEPKYEQIRERLEEVVGKLERGEETLEGGLALYEEGIGLIRAAHGILDSAEKKLSILRPRADGSFALTDGAEVLGSAPSTKEKKGAPSGADDADEIDGTSEIDEEESL